MNPLKALSRTFVLILASALFLACGQAPTANSSGSSKVEPRTNGTRGGQLTTRLTAAPSSFNYLMAKDEPTLLAAYLC
jgi:hypothetical protein